MKKYVYVVDEDYSKELLSNGYYLVDKRVVDDNDVFVLMPPKGTKNYNKLDKSKCFFTNKRYF